jgi:hypothetical protein
MKVLASVGLLSVLLCNGVEARDIEIGTILICDTEQQAKRVSTLLRGDEQNMAAAISAINAEEKGLPRRRSAKACHSLRLAGFAGIVAPRDPRRPAPKPAGQSFAAAFRRTRRRGILAGMCRSLGGVRRSPCKGYFDESARHKTKAIRRAIS